MIIYRGFKIERVIFHSNEGTVPTKDGESLPFIGPHQHVEYVVFEPVIGSNWQEIGSATDLAMAMEMIDRVTAVRQALSRTIGIAI